MTSAVIGFIETRVLMAVTNCINHSLQLCNCFRIKITIFDTDKSVLRERVWVEKSARSSKSENTFFSHVSRKPHNYPISMKNMLSIKILITMYHNCIFFFQKGIHMCAYIEIPIFQLKTVRNVFISRDPKVGGKCNWYRCEAQDKGTN